MQKTALKVSGTIFLVIAILHLLRLVFKVSFTIGACSIPMWVSVIACIVPLLLALWMFKTAKQG